MPRSTRIFVVRFSGSGLAASSTLAILLSSLILGGMVTPALADPPPSPATRFARVLEGRAPRTLDELREIQDRIQKLTDKIIAATVAIQVGRANGSGVIVDSQGHVLTAAHVAGHPGLRARIDLPNGRTVVGITLGMNQQLDAGLIKITDPGPWPYAPMGKSSEVKAGHWCLATGHPGGFDPERPPVLRWGRVLRSEDSAILTDCTLVGGDSGGPLFDLKGQVIGIHSRIGKNLTINVHVPIDPYVNSWDRLVRGEMWGLLSEEQVAASDEEAGPENEFASGPAWLGVREDRLASPGGARVLDVTPGSPAERAGLQSGDVIRRIDDTPIDRFDTLRDVIRAHRPGDAVLIRIDRNELTLELQVRLARLTPSPSR